MARGSAASFRRLVVLALVAGSALLLPGLAQACPGTLAQKFKPWLDPAYYRLAPSGGLENGGVGWQFGGGAQVVAGNEAFYLNGATDARSLSLPSGSFAQTPYMCVALADPDIRFVARNRGSLLGTLAVTVLVKTPLGVVTVPAGVVAGGSAWFPSLQMPLLANVTAPLDFGDGTGEVAVRFRPAGLLSAWQIDDVYVDPFRGR